MCSHLSTKPGWLLVMPNGYPYAWYAHSDYPTPQSVLERFEPNHAKRAALIGRGWTVRSGDATELIPAGMSGQRVSA
jgi:hypothetical protein